MNSFVWKLLYLRVYPGFYLRVYPGFYLKVYLGNPVPRVGRPPNIVAQAVFLEG